MACFGRAPMANRVRPIVVTAGDQAELERLQRASAARAGLSRRARAVLLMSHGLTGVEIAERIGYTVVQVSRIRRRFAEGGLAALHDRPKPGRPPTVSARKRAQIVALTLKPPGPGVTHWTSRDLARRTGVSHTTVHRVWRAHALKPHRVSTFKFTTDPQAEDKIHDVVGLYLAPPTNAVVLSLDEKTQIQALSRTQPLLPLRPGVPAPPHRRRLPGLPPPGAADVSGPRAARRPRQLVHPLHARGPGLADPASRGALSFHTQGRFVAEHGRGLVQHPHPQVGAPRLLRDRPRLDPPHRALPRRMERASHAVRLDQGTG